MEDEVLEKKLKQKARVRRREKRKMSIKSGTFSRQVKNFSSAPKKSAAKVKIILK